MTQTALTPTALAPAFRAALTASTLIPFTGGGASIAGQVTAQYGPMIRISHERRQGDARGPAWATRWTTFAEPAQAVGALEVMVAEGRAVYAVTAVRGALHR